MRSTRVLLLMGSVVASHAVAMPPEVIDSELSASLEASMPLEQGWQQPPRMARVHCWWWWLNGNVTKQAITRDLEEMKAKGMGGANIIDAAHASQGEQTKPPHGPDFASPEWCELFVHALKEAERLDLELGFNIQSGWNLGGPTVNPEQAAQAVTWSRKVIEGGKKVELELPQPESRYGYYREIAVVAVPLPARQRQRLARIDNFRQKSYHEYAGGFTAVDASHLLDVGPRGRGAVIDPASIQDLTKLVDSDGVLSWIAPQGNWLVLRFGYTPSGAHVSTSSDNWKGLAIDYLDRDAFEQYCDDVLSPILEVAKPYVGKSLRYLHTDSWELGPVNWTPAMPEEFRSRRGYDLQTYLPTLAGYVVEDAETSNRFLSDFRRTIAELIADGKYAAFSEYAHQRGLGIHPESGGPHAAPVDALLCLGRSDIPMGEFWARSKTHRTSDTQRLFVKQPASAAHIYGRRLVMAEAFTSIGPHWERDPRDLKPVFDRVACEGLNLVMWHTFDCSPEEAGVPGNAYFAGTHLNPHVTWWNQAEGFLGYMNRCQFLLQQGLPVSDVLYFYGENVPSFVRLKRDNPAAVPEGYDYDVVNLEVLAELAQVKDGRIVLPNGTSYTVLVLPPPGNYGLEALRNIARLAEAGATVIGEKPESAIGLLADAEQETEFTELANRLWSTGAIKPSTTSSLLRSSTEPDFGYSDIGGHQLDYIHRQTNDADIYFVVNRLDKPCRTEVGFRCRRQSVELWDPMTGAIEAASDLLSRESQTYLTIDLPANGSAFVIFRDNATPGALPAEQWQVVNTLPLEGPWRVGFDPKWGGPAEAIFLELFDWSTSHDERIRYYSGTAVYEKSFNLPEAPDSRQRLVLDLGEVESMARVHLNGQNLGVAWTTPFQVDVTPAVRKGENHFRIEVVNQWPNRLIGDAQLPPDERLTRTNISKFKQGKHALLPSGLLGPVRLEWKSPAGGARVSEARNELPDSKESK